MSIHHEVKLPATPERIYELLTNGQQFAAATGLEANLDAEEGASFTLFGGHVTGRHIELVPGQRIVQAWRGMEWDPGVYSIVRFTLTVDGAGTRLAMDHAAYPEGKSPRYPTWHEHLKTNWPVFYFEPIARYLAGKSALANAEGS